jgi:predicted kinase
MKSAAPDSTTIQPGPQLRLVLLGGPPAVGKSTVAEALLGQFIDNAPVRIQWIGVDALWRHQPWRVDETTITMLHANLHSMLHNAAVAGFDVVIVSWVFQDPAFHNLVVSLAPDDTAHLRIRLDASQPVWENRLATRSISDEHRAFYQQRYTEASLSPADHVIQTDHRPVSDIADETGCLIRAWLGIVHETSRPAPRPGQTGGPDSTRCTDLAGQVRWDSRPLCTSGEP